MEERVNERNQRNGRRRRARKGRSPGREAAPPTGTNRHVSLRRSTESRYALVGLNGMQGTYRLREGLNTCGRSNPGVQIPLYHKSVSRVHAEIEVRGASVQLRDLDAHNGTFVNGEPVGTKALRPGDEVRFGSVVLQLARVDGSAQGRPVARRGHPRRRKPRFAQHSELDSAQLTWSGPPEPAALTPPADTGLFELNARKRFVAALGELGQFLVTDHDEDRVYENCLKPVARLFNFRTACLLVLNAAGVPEVESALPGDAGDPELTVSRSLVDTVIRQRRALLVRDVFGAKLYESARLKGVRSALVVPLFENDDVTGVLYLDQDDPRRAFGERHLRRLQVLANLVAAKIARARVRNEMLWAGFIQRSLLCRDTRPPTGYEVAFKLEPSIQVGGDFYETLRLPDGRYLVALGDVAGHGVGAALLMANTLATVRALAPEAPSPLHLAERLTRLLAELLRPQGFLTLFLGFLDPKFHTLEYVSAGHEYPALFVPGKPRADIDSTGLPIGLPGPISLKQASLELPPGALLCVWSDGIPDALRRCSRPPVEFSRERLLEDLEKLRDAPPGEIVQRVFDQVNVFMNCARAHDDRTLLVLRRSVGSH